MNPLKAPVLVAKFYEEGRVGSRVISGRVTLSNHRSDMLGKLQTHGVEDAGAFLDAFVAKEQRKIAPWLPF